MKIVLMGYYGQTNIGDDLFVHQLTPYFSSRSEVEQVFVLCKENYYPQISEKVRFFADNKFSNWQKLWLILQSDRIFWGGGTLKISDRPTHLLTIQTLSRLMGKGFGFLGVGLEGMSHKKNKSSTELFKKTSFLYLRDPASYEFACNHFNQNQPICLGGDLAFLDLILYQEFIPVHKNHEIKHISFSGKFWWGKGRAEFYANQLMPIITKYDSVIHLLPGHLGEERNDNKFHHLLQKYLPEKNCQIHTWEKPEDFIRILSKMDFHFGNRLHSIIVADILGIPNIGIDKANSKVDNYIQKTGLLSQQRRVDFMEAIPIDRVETIFQQYQRPEAFIQKESEAAQQCLARIWE